MFKNELPNPLQIGLSAMDFVSEFNQADPGSTPRFLVAQNFISTPIPNTYNSVMVDTACC